MNKSLGQVNAAGYDHGIMKLIKFSAGTVGVPVWVNPEAVAAVQSDPDPNSNLTVISTQDGKTHMVQEGLVAVVNSLQQGG